ncbi:MAG: N-6 DNA methylase [Bacteroidales bacterium]|nr:N-6 DNA methylase [Bacteroidales bacterium]
MFSSFFLKTRNFLIHNGTSSQNVKFVTELIAYKALSDTMAANPAALIGFLKETLPSQSAPTFQQIVDSVQNTKDDLSDVFNAYADAWNNVLRPEWAIFQEYKGSIHPQLLMPIIEALQEITLRIDAPSEETSAALFMDGWIQETSIITRELETIVPSDVAKLMAKTISPQRGEKVYDPCAGFSSLLTAVIAEEKALRLYGQEINTYAYEIANINGMLHNCVDFCVRRDDSLMQPILEHDNTLMQFDKVLSIPPMGMRIPVEYLKYDEYNRFGWGLTARSRSEWLYLLTMLAHCREKQGKLAILVPVGMLFSTTASERSLRTKLVERNLIDAVIALPPKILHYTGIATALLIIDKRRETGGELESRRDVLFINAANMNNSKRGRASLTDDSIERIVNCYANRTTVDEFSYLANLSEVAEKEFDLSPDVYTCPPPVAEHINTEALAQDIVELEQTIQAKQQQLDELLLLLRK